MGMTKRIDPYTIDNLNGSDDKSAFRKWYHKANRGDMVIYHIGRECGGLFKHQAMSMCDDNKVHLVCTRYADGGIFAYIAVKR